MHFKLGFPLYLACYFTHLRQKSPGSIWATELSLHQKKMEYDYLKKLFSFS